MNMKAIFEVTNTTLAVVKKKTWKKFRFCTGLEPITLQYRSSILLTELTNQLGADHNQFYYILITVGYLVKPDVKKHIVLHNGRKSRKTDTTNNIYGKNQSLFVCFVRRVQTESATGSVSSNKVRTTLCIAVARVEFDTQACMLRINGRNVQENQYVKVCLTKAVLVFTSLTL